MTEAVIVSACRTAIGIARKGTLTETTPYELAHAVIVESLRRVGVDHGDFDDVIFGESLYGGGVIARHAALNAGLVDIPGLAMNRYCAASLAAVQTAAAGIRAGMDSLVIAGGVQSSSTAPKLRWRTPGTTDQWQDPWMPPPHVDTPEVPNNDMSITVGWNTAQRAKVSREEMDAWALRSHQRAIQAIDQGLFREEIVPITVGKLDGSRTVFSVDEHPRRGLTMEKLASLAPLHPEIPEFSITAGNSSGINDAAAALVVASDTYVAKQGLKPLALVRGWASVGIDPIDTGLGPVSAIQKALHRSGVRIEDVAVFEINEAFASMCVASARILGIDPEIVNVHGSGCSLGHPVAATGARMLVTLINTLRRRGGGIGVAAMCAAAGMGSAMVIEVHRAT